MDNDGSYEVVVASWTDFSATAAGSLYVISADGYLITSIQLPYGTSGDGDGALGAPTIANIDDGKDIESSSNYRRKFGNCVDDLWKWIGGL